MSESVDSITREGLYEEVWTDPVTIVAARYGLSDVGLAKICRKLLIPLPSRGYWAMLRAGRVMKKAPLPKMKGVQDFAISMERQSDEAIAAKKDAKENAKSRQKEIEAISVETELSDPHALVKQASKRLKSRDCPVDQKGLRSDPEEILDLIVTRGSVDRVLLLADALIKALEAQGAKVSLDRKQTRIAVNDTSVTFTITEHVSCTRHEPTAAEERAQKTYYETSGWRTGINFPTIAHYDYTPTGLLTITVGGYGGRNWRDTQKTKLESRIAKIVTETLEVIEGVRQRNEEDRKRAEEKQRARERYQLVVSRYNNEMSLFKQFESDADSYERAQRLRAYADVLERNASGMAGGIPSETKAWLEWAKAKADWVDPLVQVSDIILDRPKPRNPDRGYW